MSLAAVEVSGAGSSLPASAAETDPARCRSAGGCGPAPPPSHLTRSRSSGALPLGSWSNSLAGGGGEGGDEGGGGGEGARAASTTSGGRRRSWEQTRKSGLEDMEDVELTMVELGGR